MIANVFSVCLMLFFAGIAIAVMGIKGEKHTRFPFQQGYQEAMDRYFNREITMQDIGHMGYQGYIEADEFLIGYGDAYDTLVRLRFPVVWDNKLPFNYEVRDDSSD